MKYLDEYRVSITDEAKDAVREYFADLVKSEDRWGNARMARICFEDAFEHYVKRIVGGASREDMKSLPMELCDVPKFNKN
jgi:hypothetical protein